jgi:hypothetical protein
MQGFLIQSCSSEEHGGDGQFLSTDLCEPEQCMDNLTSDSDSGGSLVIFFFGLFYN